jgi:hypothetical protein
MTSAIGVPLVLDCDFSFLGIPLYVSIAGRPKFVAIVMGGGRNTAPIPQVAPMVAGDDDQVLRCQLGVIASQRVNSQQIAPASEWRLRLLPRL